MSLLQPILEQLNQERRARAPVPWLETNHWLGFGAQEGDSSGSDDQLRSSALGCHASWYRDNLAHCSEPMLQYEWAWINQRIDALDHQRTQGTPALCFVENSSSEQDNEPGLAPLHGNLAERLAESQLFLTLLLREFAMRGLRPSTPKAAVIPSEEAWEITSQLVKEEWGIL
jgi:hypothetical protein